MFTIMHAAQEDIPAMMNLIDESLPLLPEPDWFVGDTEEFYRRHISECGFTLKAIRSSDRIFAAYFTVRYPKLEPDNCGYDLNFSQEELLKTAHMETCVVHPDCRGHHLEAALMEKAISILKASSCQHLLGTVHPDNTPSVKSFLYNGFHIEKTLKKYGGKLRHIMYRRL